MEAQTDARTGSRGGPGGDASGARWAAGALLAGSIGIALLRTGGRGGLSGGILLLIVAYACAAVALGGVPYGPTLEGPLTLSVRLGLGLLGGPLAAVVVLAVQGILSLAGVEAAFGVALPAPSNLSELGSWAGAAAVWGAAFGVLLPWLPGTTIPARGAAFSLLPTLYVLLWAYPHGYGAGLLGRGFGDAAFVFVVILNLLWGAVVGGLIAWGEGVAAESES